MVKDDEVDDIEIISSEDDKVKLIGEILSNDSSRKILKTISNGTEMTAKEISHELQMSLALVTHHLKRMQSAGMVMVPKTGRSIKGQNMKYYISTKQSFLITPPEKTPDSVFESLKKFSKFVAIGLAGWFSWLIVKPESGQNDLVISPGAPDRGTGNLADEDVTEWSSGHQTITEREPESEPEPEPEPEPQPEPEPEPEPEPSHSGVDGFMDSEGSVTLDRTVYPEPFSSSGADSIEPLVISIIIPIAVIIGGLIIERILSKWYAKKKIKKLFR